MSVPAIGDWYYNEFCSTVCVPSRFLVFLNLTPPLSPKKKKRLNKEIEWKHFTNTFGARYLEGKNNQRTWAAYFAEATTELRKKDSGGVGLKRFARWISKKRGEVAAFDEGSRSDSYEETRDSVESFIKMFDVPVAELAEEYWTNQWKNSWQRVEKDAAKVVARYQLQLQQARGAPDAATLFQLAMHSAYGIGTDRDTAKAKGHFKKAAKLGHLGHYGLLHIFTLSLAAWYSSKQREDQPPTQTLDDLLHPFT